MPRPDKVAVVDEVREGLTGSAATLLAHYRGLSVTEVAELRAKLRETNARMRVAKNTLARRAARDAGMEELLDLLEGPTGLVFCEEDPVGPAKALRDFAADHPELVIRGGFFDGQILDQAEATKLADLESREDLLARLAGLMNGALANTARLLNAATEKQARLLQALVDAGGVEAKGFSPAAPASSPEETSEPAAEESASTEEATADETAADGTAVDDTAAGESGADETASDGSATAAASADGSAADEDAESED